MRILVLNFQVLAIINKHLIHFELENNFANFRDFDEF